LRTAYDIVVQSAQAPAEQNSNGKKSIHGAPSPGSGRRPTKPGMAGIDASLNRAFGSL